MYAEIGDLIVCSVKKALPSSDIKQGEIVRGVIVRKEAKAHGTGRTVEGPVEPGEEIVIVEDVVTTGGSSLLASDRPL